MLTFAAQAARRGLVDVSDADARLRFSEVIRGRSVAGYRFETALSQEYSETRAGIGLPAGDDALPLSTLTRAGPI